MEIIRHQKGLQNEKSIDGSCVRSYVIDPRCSRGLQDPGHKTPSQGFNSLTAKSVPAGTKLVLFGRCKLNIYVGMVRYILHKTKTWRAKIYLPTQCTNRQKLYDIN
jgi:hypothetical protein